MCTVGVHLNWLFAEKTRDLNVINILSIKKSSMFRYFFGIRINVLQSIIYSFSKQDTFIYVCHSFKWNKAESIL